MKSENLNRQVTLVAAILAMVLNCTGAAGADIQVVDRPDTPAAPNTYYRDNLSPLLPSPLISLPFGSIKPEGWLRKQLDPVAGDFTCHLTELSPWCNKTNNAWLKTKALRLDV